MKSKEYMASALRTESIQPGLNMNTAGTLRMLELLVAAGEVADTFKRGMFYGKGLNKDKLDHQLRQLVEKIAYVQMSLSRLDRREETKTDFFQPNMRLVHAGIGIFGEAGEMLEAITKQMTTGELDLINFAEETGDVDWYKAIAHDETGIPEETTRASNIAKLKARYAHKFTDEGANERDLAAERAVLEEGMAAK